MNKPPIALTLYALVKPTKTILCNASWQAISYHNNAAPGVPDLQAMAHEACPDYPAADFMVRWSEQYQCWKITYLPY